MTDNVFHQEQVERRQIAVDIAVLQTEVKALTADMADLKRVNTLQSEKLDLVLTQLAEAKGGLRTMLWFGGSMSTVTGIVG